MANSMSRPFHGQIDIVRQTMEVKDIGLVNLWPKPIIQQRLEERRSLSYRFATHYHPYAGALVERLIEGSVRALQAADTEDSPDGAKLPDGSPRPLLYQEVFAAYKPSAKVEAPHPVRQLDFTPGGGYSGYNWELFFHVPLTVGIHLSRNGQYESAQRWFHYIFDPTDDSEGPAPERFWKFRPFRTTQVRLAEAIMTNLATSADPALRDATIAAINAWQQAPFRPHLVARFRQSAYMVKAVTAYLDNLVAWGDSLFSQDTRESVNEATQIYILASLILGPRPQRVPSRGRPQPQSYAQLRPSLDAFSNAMRDLEADIVFNLAPAPAAPGSEAEGQAAVLESLGQTLYFCIPRNDKLLEYWDTVADRLFKIHNSLNLQGIFRQLPLFEPPIDPALLARAVAGGADIASAIAGLNQPLPLVRCLPLLSRAIEICREVQSLGALMLSAAEKEDAEALQVLRTQHERAVLKIGEQVRYGQHQDAIKAREALEQGLRMGIARWSHYERLLGQTPETKMPPSLEALDTSALEELRLQPAENLMTPREIAYDIAQGLADDLAGRMLNTQEKTEFDKLAEAQDALGTAAVFDKIAGALAPIPNFGAWAAPLGAGGSVTLGGSNLSSAMNFIASFYRSDSDHATYAAGRASKIGAYVRREQEWAYQSAQAAGEINQTLKQLRAAQIREAVAARELEMHREQMRNAAKIEEFLADERKGKTTRQSLYTWLRRETRGLYSRAFQLAFDTARKAERALQHEVGDPSASFLSQGHMSGREGLLAGERLLLELRRMEAAYHDQNQRELEMVRHISLQQLDPLALLRLRRTGSCTLRIPEEFFDIDAAGQYFRRIRGVALSIPSVVGPYASVRCRLTLLRSSIRTRSTLLDGAYDREGEADPRFSDHLGSLETIVTSSGQNDAGVFEVGARDERHMPFEGSGAISEWRIELPRRFRSFDHDSIADVVLHLRMTARLAGDPLQRAAEDSLEQRLAEGSMGGRVRLFSLRHDFPTEWARMRASQPTDAAPFVPLVLPITEEHFPFWARGRVRAIRAATLFLRPAGAAPSFAVAGKPAPAGDAEKDLLAMDAELGLLTGALTQAVPASPAGTATLCLESPAVEDGWLAIEWASEEAG